ncbi:MAG TPA: L-2-hydroxyglutarate oxidase [Candidatus Limnocylindria bacterium]
MSRTFDVAVIGAGIVGLATALRLMERHPRLRLAVVDKEARVASHQTGHNSGVVHRGVYYAPGSLKARLCTQGAEEIAAYCDAHGIEVHEVGKVIVALNEAEVPALEELHRRAAENGVPGIRMIGRAELHELEPHAAGVQALHSPRTAVVDFAAVAGAFAADVVARGGELRLATEVTGVEDAGDHVSLHTSGETVTARSVIACAGLQSDRVVALSDRAAGRKLRIVPFRGDYYVLRPERRHLVRGLIYPVPDPRFPFLGVHFTVRHDGDVWAGPNAVLALRREGYGRFSVSMRDTVDTITYGGFWRLAARHWRYGLAEIWRDYVRLAFVRALQRYVPEVRSADLVPGPSGVRAQALAADGSLVDDFVVDRVGRVLHVRNAPSPAATSSLAIGSFIADRAETELGVGGH